MPIRLDPERLMTDPGSSRMVRLPGRPLTADAALAAIGAVFVVAQLLLGALRFPLELDEATYASQFAAGVPRFPYAAHRAIGEGLLAAPLTALTSSVGALRAYMVALSGVLLYAAFRPWLRVRPGAAVPVAAALFACSWVALRFAATVLPNLPIALAAVAAVGLAVHPGRRTWAGLLVAFAGMALIRPTDAAWVGIPVLAGMSAVRAWRRAAPIAGAVVGLAIGAIAWLVDAYARFGGPVTRLHTINVVNGSNGLYLTQWRYLRSMSGKESCLPHAASCGPITATSMLWWAAGSCWSGRAWCSPTAPGTGRRWCWPPSPPASSPPRTSSRRPGRFRATCSRCSRCWRSRPARASPGSRGSCRTAASGPARAPPSLWPA
ncbi:hypothetical protein GCM10029978_100890 [Actinoallomurus acanthiterrae]